MRLNSLKNIWKGKYLGAYVANYTSDSGRDKDYEIISRKDLRSKEDLSNKSSDAVTIICFNKDRSAMLLQREFRMPVNGFVWDFPSGLIDQGETSVDAAKREMKEETGLTLTEITRVLSPVYTSVGLTNELVTPVYGIAEGTITGSDNDLEITEPVWVTKDDARKIIAGEDGLRCTNRVSAELYNWCKE